MVDKKNDFKDIFDRYNAIQQSIENLKINEDFLMALFELPRKLESLNIFRNQAIDLLESIDKLDISESDEHALYFSYIKPELRRLVAMIVELNLIDSEFTKIFDKFESIQKLGLQRFI